MAEFLESPPRPMTEFTRYAIYYAPTGPLADFASAWLGWGSRGGTQLEAPLIDGLSTPVHALTEAPRRYGFHATIKPPFRLAEGTTLKALEHDFLVLAGTLAPVHLGRLTLTHLGRFFALTATGDQTALNDMAADVARGLDAYRAPPTEQELAKRLSNRLSPRQEALLRQWGYPHVLDQFKFHMTLTGKLSKLQLAEVEPTLAAHLDPLLSKPVIISSLGLFGEDSDGYFHLICDEPLGG